jgi:Dolichyl-phosphate-mannose-protein mannosyltransferase
MWSILAFALVLRIFFAWNYIHVRPEHALGVIPFLSEPGNIAHSLATGRGFSSPFLVDTGATAWMAPVYPAILAGIFRLFGVYTYHSFLAAVALNIVCASLTVVPIFRMGTMVGGTGVGAGAAWLWAIFPNALLIPVESMWDACLSALLLALILLATLILAESRSTRAWLGYGFLWGFALTTNPSLGSLFPILAMWAGFRVESRAKSRTGSRTRKFAWIKRPALSLAVALLCCVPWTVRNYIVFHGFVPVRSAVGLSLWLGNNAGTGVNSVGSMHPISSSIERDEYVALGEPEYMRVKRREAVVYILSHPGRASGLMAERFISFWSGGATHPIDDFVQKKSLWFRYVLLFNIAAGIGCVAGIVVLLRRHDSSALPLASLPVVYPLVYYLTVVTPRYRFPLDPVALLLTAIASRAFVATYSSVRNPHAKALKGVEASV